jgi:uncharacterized protein (TIGR02145 family)
MTAVLIVVYAAFLLSCSGPEDLRDDTLTDSRDGKTYRIIAMGTQTWMAENLNYNAPSSRCYNDGPANCDKYGRLYNWATALSVCPDGWHLPSDDEWTRLTIYVGSDAAVKLKVIDGWDWNNWNGADESGNGTDYYGFSALPSGERYPNGTFTNIGFYTMWWSTIDGWNNETLASTRGLNSINKNGVINQQINKLSLISVRCIKD